MPHRTRHCESMLFNFETTYTNDYRYGEVKPLVRNSYWARNRRPDPEFVHLKLKDIHALTPWRDPNIPFNLYHKPEPIVQTNPHIIQKRYEKPPDVDRAEVQKTRPKVIMTPAMDLDGVEEPSRQMFMDYIYVSVGEKALREVVRKGTPDVRAPLSEVYAPSNPLAIEPLIEPYVSPEWRMDSASWDGKQMRTYTEPTKTFWLTRPPPYCPVCESDTNRDAMKKRRRH